MCETLIKKNGFTNDMALGGIFTGTLVRQIDTMILYPEVFVHIVPSRNVHGYFSLTVEN